MPVSGEGADRANIRRGGRLCQYQEREPTVPESGEGAVCASIRRRSRLCQYQERVPTVPVSGEGPTAPVSGEGADRANFCVRILQPTGRSHVPPHPNPLPREERGPTEPISGEGANRATVFCEDPSNLDGQGVKHQNCVFTLIYQVRPGSL